MSDLFTPKIFRREIFDIQISITADFFHMHRWYVFDAYKEIEKVFIKSTSITPREVSMIQINSKM